MPVSHLTKALPVKVARHTLGLFGRVLRPLATDRGASAEPPVVELFAPSDDDRDARPEDSSATRELLLAAAADEPPAERASRQARAYLERRRRRLNEQLHAEP